MKHKTQNERILLGLKIRQLRQQKNLSLKNLSTISDISVSYLNEIEKGKKSPKGEKLNAIATALEVDVEELTNIDLGKNLSPITELLNSNFLNELPLNLFDIDLAKVIEIIANAPAKVGAFISTLVEISRNYALAEESFYFGALRSYLELHSNYFEEIEKQVDEFVAKYKFKKNHQAVHQQLEELLKKKYKYEIVEGGLDGYPELSEIRSVFIPKNKRLLLNGKLTEMQKAFQYGKELGFKFLDLKERANTATLLKVNTFEEVLSHFKAGYFSAALLVNREEFIQDLTTFFNKEKWDGEFIMNLLNKYQVTQETLVQRMTNLLPKYFDIESLFMIRVIHTPSDGKFKVDKELHLNRKHRPHANALSEHYCRRWLSISILNNLTEMQQKGRYVGALVGIQRSKYFNTEDEYLCFTLARPAYPSPERNVSITVGVLIDNYLKDKVKFLDDENIVAKEVNTTCERCSIENCQDRVVPPDVITKKKIRKQREDVLKRLQSM